SVCSGSSQYLPSVCQVGPIRTGSHCSLGSCAGCASSCRYQASISASSSTSSLRAAARLRAISEAELTAARGHAHLQDRDDDLQGLLLGEPGLDVSGVHLMQGGGRLAHTGRGLTVRHRRPREEAHPVLLLHRAIAALRAALDTDSCWRPSSDRKSVVEG